MTDLARLHESRQTQKGIISTEQNKLQSRSGKESGHGGAMISFLLWNGAMYSQVNYENLYLIDSIQNNLLKSTVLILDMFTYWGVGAFVRYLLTSNDALYLS